MRLGGRPVSCGVTNMGRQRQAAEGPGRVPGAPHRSDQGRAAIFPQHALLSGPERAKWAFLGEEAPHKSS
ncbi:hypothetical protein CesoFtcFv8_004476 [Champsocephalus esox]|uniref:Uncharacterized protein n=3 Tax=Channichthyidae TaxID=30806 RepID=A0AAN8E0K1_CHAGU|nr:hypothetical protein KUCAC02_022334 [Chaenocephalus aceratus]KAK5906538.1 hypothetical protein CesoFtcFv8_004476 [Champsocephalus esox]KAK5930093.1 hypothetical protein CgunFtcFv8_026357 [Champsocephalus gunnari]